jgi:hypothetical protein
MLVLETDEDPKEEVGASPAPSGCLGIPFFSKHMSIAACSCQRYAELKWSPPCIGYHLTTCLRLPQFCLTLSIVGCLEHAGEGGTVLYIDTEQKFSSKR